MSTMPLQSKQDSKYFKEVTPDQSIGSATDGGYRYTRPKYTSAPKKTFTTGFTILSNDDKIIFEEFYNTVRGGSDGFLYTHPINGTSHNVRFVGSMNFDYVGMGYTRLWNITNITLEEI